MTSCADSPTISVAYQGNLLAGVDEVGRGPLAGDVVAAAVILSVDHPIEGLRDSKKLSEKRRELLYDQIIEHAKAYAIGRANSDEIDSINILQASLLAMSRAVSALAIKPEHVVVDGNRLPSLPYPAQAIIGGDNLIDCISAASILAKVTRDREMLQLAEQYPHYGFEKHKGYPTKQHMRAIEQYGVTVIHRRSFAPVKRAMHD